MIKVGEDALKKKIADVEQDNMSVKGNALKQRLPTKLEFDEVAVIMMSIFTFRSIQMTDE